MKFKISPIDLLDFKLTRKIVEFLLTNKTSMSEREMASILKISHMSINRILNKLAAANFVSYNRIGNSHLWEANTNSFAYKVYSRFIYAIHKCPEPIEDLKRIIIDKIPKNSIVKVILFGSVSKGLEKSDSDIDIFILIKNDQDKIKIERCLDELSEICLGRYGNRLTPYILNKLEFKKGKNSNIISEIEKGIQIYPK